MMNDNDEWEEVDDIEFRNAKGKKKGGTRTKTYSNSMSSAANSQGVNNLQVKAQNLNVNNGPVNQANDVNNGQNVGKSSQIVQNDSPVKSWTGNLFGKFKFKGKSEKDKKKEERVSMGSTSTENTEEVIFEDDDENFAGERMEGEEEENIDDFELLDFGREEIPIFDITPDDEDSFDPNFRLTPEQIIGLLRASGFSVPDDLAPLTPEIELQLKREAALKKRVFQILFQREFNQFLKNPDPFLNSKATVIGTFYLRFLSCPVFDSKDREKTMAKLIEVTKAVTKLNVKLQGRSKQRIQKSFGNFVVDIFAMSEKTELDVEVGLRKTYTRIAKLTNKMKGEESTRANEKKRLLGYLALASEDIVSKGGTSYLFSILKQAPTINDLPDLYKKIVDAVRRTYFPNFIKIMETPETMAKLKSFYSKLPKKMMAGILKVTNPVKFIAALTGLFSKDFMSSLTLLQHILISSVNINQEIRRANSIGKDLPKFHQNAILSFISEYSDRTVGDEELERFVHSKDFMKSILKMAQIDIDEVDEQLLERCMQFFDTLLVAKEKEALIEILRSEQVKAIVKELTPIFQALIVEVYAVGDLPKIFGELLLLMKKMINASEPKSTSEAEKMRAYNEIMVQSISIAYGLFRNIVGKENGAGYRLVKWLLESWNKPLKLGGIQHSFSQLNQEEKEEMWKDVDTLRGYFERGGTGESLGPPSPIFQKLADILEAYFIIHAS